MSIWAEREKGFSSVSGQREPTETDSWAGSKSKQGNPGGLETAEHLTERFPDARNEHPDTKT